jgi:hypothetical protein
MTRREEEGIIEELEVGERETKSRRRRRTGLG